MPITPYAQPSPWDDADNRQRLDVVTAHLGAYAQAAAGEARTDALAAVAGVELLPGPQGPAGSDANATAVAAALTAHQASTDHDGRYYTESEVDALLAAVGPRYIHIPCLLQPVQNTGFTLAAAAPDRRTSSGSVNDTCSWDVYVPAGTWELALTHQTSNNRGRYTVAVGGSSVGVIDGYSVSAVAYVESLIAGLTYATGAVRRVTLTMADRNALSSSFVGALQSISLRRTA